MTYSLRSALLSPAALWAFIGATIVVLLFSFGVSLHGKDAPTAKVQPLRLRRLQGGGGLQSLLSSGRTVGAAEVGSRPQSCHSQGCHAEGGQPVKGTALDAFHITKLLIQTPYTCLE